MLVTPAFLAHLMVEVTEALLKAEQDVAEIEKPDCFDYIKTSSTIDELNDRLDSLDDKQKSESLLYAFAERDDNTNIIPYIADSIDTLDPAASKLLLSSSPTVTTLVTMLSQSQRVPAQQQRCSSLSSTHCNNSTYHERA